MWTWEAPFDLNACDICGVLAEQARERPGAVFLEFDGVRYTFADMWESVVTIANNLTASGLNEGERVCGLMGNCVEFVQVWFATIVAGGIFVPVNTHLRGASLEHVLVDAAPSMSFVSGDLMDRFTECSAASSVSRVYQVGSGPASYASVDQFGHLCEGPVRNAPSREARPDDAAMIMYTSGTTGPPKGILLPNSALFASATAFGRVVDLTPEDTLYSPLPLFHGVASGLGVVPCLLAGAKFVLGRRFSASNYWQEATRAGATVGHLVTALPSLLMKQPPSELDRRHSVRVVYNAKYDPAFEERFGVGMGEAWGLSECGLVTLRRPEDRRVGSCGRVHSELYELRLVDGLEREVPLGQAGEAIVRPRIPHTIMQGYFNNPGATMEAFQNLWMHTGDLLREDAEGYFYFVDRKKDSIRRRGENVSTWEIERVLLGHPKVAEVAVVGYPGEDQQEDVRAVVVAHAFEEIAPEELVKLCEIHLPYFAVPRYVEFARALPRTATGKVVKQELRTRVLAPETWDAEQHGYQVKR